MKRKQVILLGILAVAALVVAWLAMGTRQPPMLPADEDHAAFENAETCMVCHGPEGGMPQSETHPLGFDCMRCHGRR